MHIPFLFKSLVSEDPEKVQKIAFKKPIKNDANPGDGIQGLWSLSSSMQLHLTDSKNRVSA